jgi:hypothetical protein
MVSADWAFTAKTGMEDKTMIRINANKNLMKTPL